MNSKTLIQVSLIILIFVISILFYKKYFSENPDKTTVEKKIETNVKIDDQKLPGNTIKDIIYTSEDETGNTYTIKAEYGEFSDKTSEIIFMKMVSAFIKLKDGSLITLISQNAKYNIVNNDTSFYDSVKLDYLNHDVNADNIDFFFKDGKLEAYNNLVYRNLDLNLIADKIEVDLMKKKSKIFMFNNKKVKIFKD